MIQSSASAFDDRARANMKRWVDDWARVGPLLEARRVVQLRALTEADAARIAVDLLWPMTSVGHGDAGEGLAPMRDALRKLAAQSASS